MDDFRDGTRAALTLFLGYGIVSMGLCGVMFGLTIHPGWFALCLLSLCGVIALVKWPY